MALPNPETVLTPKDIPSAERHVGQRLGAADEGGTTESAPVAAENRELLDGLDRADRALSEAFGSAQPSAAFASKVMSVIAAEQASAQASSRPTVEPSGGLKVYALPSANRRRWWLAAAALLLVTAGSWFWMSQGRTFHFEGASPGLRVARGALIGSDGRRVDQMEPGRQYRVAAGESVVIKAGEGALLRLEPETQFEVPTQEAAGALLLQNGLLYAHEPGAQPLLVRCVALDAEVAGITMLQQEGAQSAEESDGEGEGWGQAIVWVIKGQTRVRTPLLGQALTIGEGEMYVSGLEVEPVQIFLETVDARSRQLNEVARSSEGQRAERHRYLQEVRGYEQHLQSIDRTMGETGDAKLLAELKERRALVEKYRVEHRQHLETLPDGSKEESPGRRAKRLKRAAEELLKGQDGFVDPKTWM